MERDPRRSGTGRLGPHLSPIGQRHPKQDFPYTGCVHCPSRRVWDRARFVVFDPSFPEDVMAASMLMPFKIKALPRMADAITDAGIPGQVMTLAAVEPGQTAEVRCILQGAGDSAALLRPGDRVLCRGRTSDWLVVEIPRHGELAVHRADARHVQIERALR